MESLTLEEKESLIKIFRVDSLKHAVKRWHERSNLPRTSSKPDNANRQPSRHY